MNVKLKFVLFVAFCGAVSAMQVQEPLTEERIAELKKLVEEQEATLRVETQAIHPDIIQDAFMTTTELAVKYGYPAEIHHVTTDDGYILEIHRIPGSPLSPPAAGKPVAYLQHGLLDSTGTWVIMGPNNGFAYMLADLGYDVWMGNTRGNRYSRRHVSFNPDGWRRREFWEFSWHEIGIFDLPALIDYTLEQTGQEKVHYIGHSQGTTAYFVMCSERPEYNDKVFAMHALAPIAFMSNLRSPFVRAMVVFLNTLDFATSILGVHEFLPSSDLLALGGQAACRDEAFTQSICSNVIFLLAGFNSPQLNQTMLPVIMGHTPAGAATQQLIHYGQGVRSALFRKYDHGYIGNRREYSQRRPPNYTLANIRSKVALYYSMNDWLAEPVDVYELARALPNLVEQYQVSDPQFNHLDFNWAIDVRTLVYNKVVDTMRLHST